MSSYQYSKLADESVDIRLLTLLPGQPNSDIRITIHHTPLKAPPERTRQQLPLKELRKTLLPGWEAYETVEGRFIFENDEQNITSWTHPDPSVLLSSYDPLLDPTQSLPLYEALSYTWGTADSPQTAEVVPQADSPISRTLRIQQNLASALKHMRYTDKPRTLWVDAICINQNDVPEKNTQVPRMADIYRLADHVVIWLGAETHNSNLAISTLDYLGAQIEITKTGGRLPSPKCAHQDWFRSLTELPYDDHTWQAIVDLVNRPWFGRLWVLQEVQLSNHKAKMQGGLHEISWQRFRRAIVCLEAKRNLPQSVVFSRLPRLGIFCLPVEGVNFASLLLRITHLECSNPRDKVYGLLGLASPSFLARVRPQYSLPVSSIYRDLFLSLTDQTKRLHLEFCSLRTSRPRQLASWIPDLSGNLVELLFRGGRYASGMSRADAICSTPDVLEVRGIPVDTLQSNKGVYPDDTAKRLAALRSWKTDSVRTGLYPTGEPLFDAFASSLAQDQLRDRLPTSAVHPYLHEWKDKLSRMLSNPQNSASGHPNNTEIGSHAYDLRFITKQAFVTSKSGYFGLGHQDAEPGDIVCAILGCSALVILRPGTGGTFQVVGSCYLHGFCNAEAFLGPLPGAWSIQYKPDFHGAQIPSFYNKETEEETEQDPRLDKLPPEWEPVQADRTRDDPTLVKWFRNNITRETMNSDPRMLPEALKSRNISLQTFRLA
ncbi:Fc.00g094480.m01.CDS01 [Cosmosporella sp. VM-42]